MTLLNIISFAILFRIIGGGIIQMPRWIPLIASGALLLYQVHEPMQIVAYAWLFFVVRIVPTQGLFSAIHSYPPLRDDGMWRTIQDISLKLWRMLPNKYRYWDMWAIIYGLVRASLALPAMIYLDGLSYLFLAQGALYYAVGKIKYKYPITICELVSGAVFGGLIPFS